MKKHHGMLMVGVLLLAVFMSRPLYAEEHVYLYPFKLTAQDTLVDGPSSSPVEVAGDSMLLWVDLLPEALFVHPTLYVLISHTSTTIVQGEWWPELNGKRVLYGEPSNYTIASPFILTSSTETIHIHMYPFTLTQSDNLTDGPQGDPIEIQEDETMLIWVDLQPGAWFSHATVYVLISDEGSRAVRGSWWPVLNGKSPFEIGPTPTVDYTLISPFIKGSSSMPGTRVGRAQWKRYR